MMPRFLPPPPLFTLPPPPMPPSDLFDLKIVSQLTCSSIQQQYQQTMTTSSRLILFTSASVIVAILLFIITLIWLLSSRKQKQSHNNHNLKSTQPPTSIDSMFDLSTSSSRSYETISSNHTGVYLESVDTSATTCSIDTTGAICIECNRQHGLPPAPYYHIFHVPDVVPN
ncbi:unnamed protein product [Rotaria sordida]|uniref:Uncharacterized protein n=1 Tax=Rotaria sordida TaxID=392033 RepID=A0A813TQK4_9BILA|nr:unnamed protein product [Rotaria sordida]CAF0810397.1 unnamed protein product [Rotaria sordida]CAF0813013.1 unnamed protein product [Rotaria sordida]CAF0838294.1 unnamed protein product [Rotaria sordida]CAF3534918.1 unnamed protein product [Rotaria sordida]